MRPDVAKLRQTILQLAVEGKLVAQNPSDEPASKLLKQVEAEKQKLINEGKIRKPKDINPVKEDDLPYSLPPNWSMVKMGALGDWGSGATPLRSNNEYYGEGMPWLKSGEMNGGYIYDAEEYVTEKALKECSLRLCEPGDLLVAMYGATAGKTAILGIKATTNQAVSACTPFSQIDISFFHLSAKAAFGRLIEQASGAAQPNISQIKIRNTTIGLPPIEEQKRIVTKVDKLMTLCDELDGKSDDFLTILTKFRQTILQLAIEGKLVPQDSSEEPASELLRRIEAKKRKLSTISAITDDEKPSLIPLSWEWVRLSDITEINIGRTPSRSNSSYWDSGIYNWVSIADMKPFGRLASTKELISEKANTETFKGKIVDAGTLIMSFKLTIGRVSILDVPAFHNEAIASFPFYVEHQRLSRFFFWALPALNLQQFKSNAVKGGTLNKAKLQKLVVPLPPLEEQKRIVAKVDELMSLCDELQSRLVNSVSI